ncbi:alpha-ketoglutarate-dependent dioxygenase AlkB [Oculatella sp. LEGE 06141]|uniref:alpha-ketoglutarate-dependent dioxygenase AlkB n=1 Tax=Oculatella sp. LEGE 06141 TaxID=1828648 RepID=UPI00187FBB39|nr:alpha-ketoglutarate-dependent dioxygenase AlkB [Oculatella sp. LEGE 06141]MBE9178740.1 alpha-ketoglutarate-dependent dioxygenase AlkB [Oculatella sp. LEGE 06141]
MQLDLLPRKPAHLAPGCVHIPDWLSLDEQAELVEWLRDWCKGGFWTPTMPNGTPMNHPLCGLGLNWKPYEYFETDRPFPARLHFLSCRALEKTLPRYLGDYFPNVAIVNYFPVGSSLGMHQDRSEDSVMRESGSPIVTISLGDSCTFRLGNCQHKDKPHHDIELRSGDVLVMGGESRMAFHGVMKIHANTATASLGMKAGRLSVTIRQTRRVGK